MPIDHGPRIEHYQKTLHDPGVRGISYLRARDAPSALNDGPLDYTYGRVYLCKGLIICSPNSGRVVDLPPPLEDNLSLKFDPVHAHPMALHQPLWWSEETAYLAFVSLLPRYVGLQAKHSLPPFSDPMEILKYQVKRADRRGFGLEPWRKLAWYSLEQKTLAMVDLMKMKYSLPPIRQVVENALTVKSFYRNKHTFFADANKAMKWFSAIAAQLTWSIAMAITLDDEIGTALEDETPMGFFKRPSWLQFLSSYPSRYWDEPTLQSLRKCIGAFGRQRPKVGVFINILNPPRHQYSAEWLMKFDVPVYYIWDPATALENPALARFHPPLPLLQELLTSVQNVAKLHCIPLPYAISMPDEDFASFQDDIAPYEIPLREDYSHVVPIVAPDNESAEPGDDTYLRPWIQFSQSRRVETEKVISRESPKDAQARQQREHNPPTVNTRVYIWEEGDNGVYTRVQVTKNENYDTLASFKTSNKIYNSVFNEWDCSYDFIVNDAASNHGYESDEDDDVYADFYKSTNTDIDIPLPKSSATFASDQDLQDVPLSNLLTLFREYLGYIPSLSVEPDCDPLPNKYIMHVRNFVGMSNDQCGEIRDSTIRDLHDFITQILRHKTTTCVPSAPVDSWDLVFGNRQYLGCHPCLQGLTCVVGTDSNKYVMFDFGERRTEQWNLVVYTSVSAVFVCRLGGSWTERAICSELIKRGIPFFTPLPLQQIKKTIPRLMQTDVLPANYQFTREDYESYIDFRTDLLNNSRICRAALMRGGIVWRLSLSHAEVSEESVLLGPTKYVRQQGMSTTFNDGSWQDDCITLEELNVICGTYECLTGKGLQTVTMSWWPPYSIWRQCYDYEYWTSAMEGRFRERLRCIDAGTASPMSKQQWREWVRGGKITRDAKVSVNSACDEFLRAKAGLHL